MRHHFISCILVVVFSCGSLASSSNILEKLARIRTKTSLRDQQDAVVRLVERLFPGRSGDFVLVVNQTHFALKNNMDAFEYETSEGIYYNNSEVKLIRPTT